MKTTVHCHCLFPAFILIVVAAGSAFGGSGTWLSSPLSDDWNTSANWSPITVPNGTSDTATFDSSSISNVSLSANTQVNGILFTLPAHPTSFAITASPTRTLTINGIGITNNSGVTQNFMTAVDAAGNAGKIAFHNSATVGSMTLFTNNGATIQGPSPVFIPGGETDFFDTSSAGNALINNNQSAPLGPGLGGTTGFFNSSTAASATINNNGATVDFATGGETDFFGTSTAGNATINNNGATSTSASGSLTAFVDASSAGGATINNNASPVGGGAGITVFGDTSTASNATINNGAKVFFGGASTAANATINNNAGGFMQFQGTATAGNATITNNGGETSFAANSTAGNATIINNVGGVTDFIGGSEGSATLIANDVGRIFLRSGETGTARVEVFDNGSLDISNGSAVTIGSLEGTGAVFLGANNLTVGSNDLSTVFSGVIQDQDGLSGGTGGALTKIGAGMLTLSGANIYTGDTTINGGVLQVDGSIASPNTFVNPRGTLGGTGTVRGDVSNEGIVAPGDSPGTLHVGGNFSQSSGGTLEIEIASLLSFDQLMVAGTATLGGTLDVSLDGYTGHAGDMFTILTSSGLSGNFLNLDLPTLSDGLFFTERVTSNDVILTVSGSTSVPDQGSTLLLMAGALTVLFGVSRFSRCLV